LDARNISAELHTEHQWNCSDYVHGNSKMNILIISKEVRPCLTSETCSVEVRKKDYCNYLGWLGINYLIFGIAKISEK
jgi:hypothetical protein